MNLNDQVITSLRVFLLALLISTNVFLCGCSQKKEKVFHVGILSGLTYFADTAEGFKEKMKELGYVEGKNIVYDLQSTNFDVTAYKEILKKFIADKVDLIFVFPTEASQEAKAAARGTGVPVVFANANVDDTGLINSIREPGGNITGVRFPGPDIALKTFEVMCQLAPKARRILVPYQKNYPTVRVQLEAMRPFAKSIGVTLIEAPANNAKELKVFIESRDRLEDTGIDAILSIPEPLVVDPDAEKTLYEFANKHRLPSGGTKSRNKINKVFTVTVDNFSTGKQAGLLADKIFTGFHAGTIPVVSSELYLRIYYAEGKKLGLNMSDTLLAGANEVIH